ncbi:heme exporter protein CcmD [Legionella massiliensis]|uniref:Heme exporter protein D n=1 Tax=Legionella massiliensis TaxID=1034943 RepID=A0A078L130_9GAMM|nr:heme exporter protein CcmD [Legionella massiliensis]CDZ78917.1 heme exporter protein CcmD [Legionella massiliensis]CEE14655.1 Heme exporter protein D (CcmD) [Legionella massiliensis]
MRHFLQWFAMGGYSFYVWTAYGLVFAVLASNILAVRVQRTRVRKRLEQWFKRQAL